MIEPGDQMEADIVQHAFVEYGAFTDDEEEEEKNDDNDNDNNGGSGSKGGE